MQNPSESAPGLDKKMDILIFFHQLKSATQIRTRFLRK